MTPKERLIVAAHALHTGAVSGSQAVDFLADWVAADHHRNPSYPQAGWCTITTTSTTRERPSTWQ